MTQLGGGAGVVSGLDGHGVTGFDSPPEKHSMPETPTGGTVRQFHIATSGIIGH